ncbi:MAG TPA: hypothetical protein VNH18_04630, partial [Bryobacteraceae bacterium]|nr:hypothetical protein [Bryobacteraceae bacterium]
GGVNSPPNVSYDSRLLTGGTDFTFNINDNVSITKGKHLIKFGGDFYRIREYEGEQSTFSGTFDFGRNTSNPLDTNYAFSNAAIGVFNSYTESNQRYGANMRQSEVEWFLQDSWKVTKRFTLDYGVRWSWTNEMHPNRAGEQSVFALNQYKASEAPQLFQPVIANNVRQAKNPVTGALLPAAYIGLFVPNTGNPAPGGVTSGSTTLPSGFVNQPPVLWGPRLGFAWDPFGNGKTAIRGGASILYTLRVSKWSNMVNNPPAIFTPITYYGDMRTFLQTAGLLSPSNTQGFFVNNKIPNNYNMTLGIQQDLTHNILLDVSYLGVLGQHIPQTAALNTIPYGSRFAAQNQDPTSPGKPLPDNFFRPLPGYNNVSFIDDAYNSNYHALLLSLNRRFSKGLQFGVSYSFSKYLDYSNVPVYRSLKSWGYGFNAADQTHNVAINYSWELPKASRLKDNRVVRVAFDGWQLSGVSQFVSGSPLSVGFTTVQGTDLTGGGDGQRIRVVGNPNSNGSTFGAWFNPAAFAVPGLNDPGNASKNSVRSPGVNNNDVSLSKRFAVKKESRYVEFRWEAYNVLNHTQYSGLNATARYDLTTGAQTNALFGQVTSTRSPRIMQGALRFVF